MLESEAFMYAVANPLHGVERIPGVSRGYRYDYNTWNPLHGVESYTLIVTGDMGLIVTNPLHGVERDRPCSSSLATLSR